MPSGPIKQGKVNPDYIAPLVPKRGNVGGQYDSERNLPSDIPGRDTSPMGLPELYRDTAVTSKSPSKNGPITQGKTCPDFVG